MMGMRWLVLILAALAVSLAGCGPRQPREVVWQDAGFVRHAGAGTEAFLSLKRPGEMWHCLAETARPLLEDQAVEDAWSKSAWASVTRATFADLDHDKWEQALDEASKEEVFIAFGSGTAEQLASLQQIKRLFEAARLRNLFTPALLSEVAPGHAPAPDVAAGSPEEAALSNVGIPLPPAMEAALEKFVSGASVPPVTLGAKIPDHGAKLPERLNAWALALGGDPASSDTIADGPYKGFTRVRTHVARLVPREAAVRARDLLGAEIGDAYAATRIVRALLSKPAVICFGHTRGYFLVCVSPTDTPPPLADNFASSLAATQELARVADMLGPQTRGVFHANTLLVSLAAAPPPVGEYLDAAIDSAVEFAPAERIRPLKDAATKLRSQAEAAFRSRTAAATGLLQNEESMWKIEMFGGSVAPRLAKENGAPLLDGTPAGGLLWCERWETGYTGQLAQLASGLAQFAADWTETLGPTFLDPRTLAQTKAAIALGAKPVQRLGLVPPAKWDLALGPDRALAVVFDGVMPPPPLMSVGAAKALLPRVAVAANVKNPAALDEVLASATPDNLGAAAETKLPGGGTCKEFAVPFGGPDLSPAAAREKGLWILGTSAYFVRALAEQNQDHQGAPCVQSINLGTAPMAAFLSAWADAVDTDPSLASLPRGLLPSKVSTLRAAAEVLRIPRKIGLEMRWEGQEIRRTIRVAPGP